MVVACSEGDGPPAIDAGASAPRAVAVATLSALTGTVTLTRKGLGGPAKVGSELFVGDIVETGAESNATSRFNDGHEVELGANGRFEIGSTDDGLVLNVGQGLVLSRVVGDLPSGNLLRLAISTPYGLVRLGSGEVKIGIGPGDANIDVVTGDVQIVSRGGDSLTVTAGDLSVLSREGVKKGERVVRLEPLQIDLATVTGRVDLKKKDAKAFVPINSRKLPTLDVGDSLRVAQGSATLTPKGSGAKLVVNSNSEVGIGEVQTGSGLEDIALDLRKGAMTINMPLGTKRKLRPGDGYTLSVNDGAQFSIARSKTGLDINTIVGEVVLEHDSMDSVSTHGAQIARLTPKGAVTLVELAKETLLIPSRSGLKLFHPNVGQAALVWAGEAGTAFHIIVGNEPTLANPSVDGTVKQPWLNVNVPARGNIWWRVLDGETEVARGSVACAPERASGELSRLRNEVPDGAEKTVIYYQDKPPSVTFLWKSPDPAPAEYRLQVYREGALDKAIEERLSKSATLQLPENALGEGNYLWSVTPLDANGVALAGGRMNKLEMVYDNAVAELVIKSPRNGDPGGATVPVIGIAPFKTRVSANGQLLVLDEKARFNSKVAPVGGRVVFRTVGDNGEQLIVRALRRGK